MNQLFIGLTKIIEPEQRCLFIHDEVPDIPRARLFDPAKHSFNPLKNMSYEKQCHFVDLIDALFPRGDGTLTKDTGLDFIAEALESKPKTLADLIPVPDHKSPPGHIWAYNKIRRILRSPVLKNVLCKPTNFSFAKNSLILARLNRIELTDFDALLLGWLLIEQFKGQVVVPDFGFYGRDVHVSLLRENRLIAGVNFLSELPPKLRNSLLLVEDKIASGTTFDDAEVLADFARIPRGTNAFNSFVDEAMNP